MGNDTDRFGAFCPGSRVELQGSGEGPLVGTRFAAKDLFDVAGHVTGGGNPDWQRTHAPATRTAEVIERLLAAGADLAGKTQMDELAYGALGENMYYGTPLNPAAPDRVPGGSSSGSASAVAGGLADFALGSDSACSVRLPAALCGIFGMRPTWGRVSTAGMLPLSPSLDTVGWFARSASLMREVGRVLLDAASGGRTPPRRLLIPGDAFSLADHRVSDALGPAVQRLEGLFDDVRREPLLPADTEDSLAWLWFHVSSVQIREVWSVLGEWIEAIKPASRVLNRENMAAGAASTDADMNEARRRWQRMRALVEARIPPGTFACLPTTTNVAPLKGSEGEVLRQFTRPTLCLMSIAGIAGLPQLTLPLASVDGLPVGLSLVGPRGGDEALLDIGWRLEEG